MKVELEISEAAWEADYLAIVQAFDKVTPAERERIRKETGKEPLSRETIAAHLFKLGIQSYKREISQDGLSQADVIARARSVEIITLMIQALIDHYRTQDAVAGELRKKIKDTSKAVQAGREAFDQLRKKIGDVGVKLLTQEIFMNGIVSVFAPLDQVLGGSGSVFPRPPSRTVGKPVSRKPRKR